VSNVGAIVIPFLLANLIVSPCCGDVGDFSWPAALWDEREVMLLLRCRALECILAREMLSLEIAVGEIFNVSCGDPESGL